MDHIDQIAHQITDDPDVNEAPIVLTVKCYPSGRGVHVEGDDTFHRAVSNVGEAGNILRLIGKAVENGDLLRDMERSQADEWLESD